MLVKVQKVGKSWFRCDNGALIGREIPPGKYLNTLKSLYGNKFLLKNDANITIVYHGYFDNYGNFNHFCKKTGRDCIGCHDDTKKTFCPHLITKRKRDTGGYYAKTD